MFDKNGNVIKLGDIISDKRYRGDTYRIINYKDKLYADNGGRMFPLDSNNENLKRFEIRK